MIEQLIVLSAALIANTFSALAGGGAGLIQFPVLLFLGLPFSIALATHKVASVALGIGASVRYIKEDFIEKRFALFLLMTGLPGVIVGAFIATALSDTLGKNTLGLLTVSLGVYSFFQYQFGQTYTPKNQDTRGFILGGIGLFFVGFLNGAIASGTGLFATILLVKWFGLDYKRAVAYTLIVVGLFWNGVGGATLALMMQVKWSWIPMLLLGSFVGGYLGAHLAILKGNLWIKRGYEIVTILVGVKLLLS